MYRPIAQSIPKSEHTHQLIELRPGKGEDQETVTKCGSCGRLMLVEHDETADSCITSCPYVQTIKN